MDQIVVFVAINIALLTKDKHVSYSAMSNEFQMGGEVGEKSNINVNPSCHLKRQGKRDGASCNL